jgi:acyl-coenzyme A thioesterase PaaI-like protein
LNVSEAPYRIDGEFVVPGPNAGAGWDRRFQSGHVISPLLAHLIEAVPTLTPMLTTRCIVDLTRPIPVKPLRWQREIVREGKKLQVVRSSLHDGEVELCSLTALRARTAVSPAWPQRQYPGPEHGVVLTGAFEVKGFELREIESVRRGAGRCTMWSHLRGEIVQGHSPTPFMRAMSLADFGSGMANALGFDEWNFPNIDIAVMFFRPPEGEWILLDAQTETAGNGLGLVSSTLADARGAFARCHQTLFIDPVARGQA